MSCNEAFFINTFFFPLHLSPSPVLSISTTSLDHIPGLVPLCCRQGCTHILVMLWPPPPLRAPHMQCAGVSPHEMCSWVLTTLYLPSEQGQDRVAGGDRHSRAGHPSDPGCGEQGLLLLPKVLFCGLSSLLFNSLPPPILQVCTSHFVEGEK